MLAGFAGRRIGLQFLLQLRDLLFSRGQRLLQRRLAVKRRRPRAGTDLNPVLCYAVEGHQSLGHQGRCTLGQQAIEQRDVLRAEVRQRVMVRRHRAADPTKSHVLLAQVGECSGAAHAAQRRVQPQCQQDARVGRRLPWPAFDRLNPSPQVGQVQAGHVLPDSASLVLVGQQLVEGALLKLDLITHRTPKPFGTDPRRQLLRAASVRSPVKQIALTFEKSGVSRVTVVVLVELLWLAALQWLRHALRSWMERFARREKRFSVHLVLLVLDLLARNVTPAAIAGAAVMFLLLVESPQPAAVLRPVVQPKLRVPFGAVGVDRVQLDAVRAPLRELHGGYCFYCAERMPSRVDVDHFIPWSRYADNGLDNLVPSHPKCNRLKRDFIAAEAHLEQWVARMRDREDDLSAIARDARWYRDGRRSEAVAKSIYLRLPDGARLWQSGSELVPGDRTRIADAFKILGSG